MKKQTTTVKPLDPREAARKFTTEAKHDWRAGVRALVRAVSQTKGGAA